MFILFSSSFEMPRHFKLLQLDDMVTGQPNQASLHIKTPAWTNILMLKEQMKCTAIGFGLKLKSQINGAESHAKVSEVEPLTLAPINCMPEEECNLCGTEPIWATILSMAASVSSRRLRRWSISTSPAKQTSQPCSQPKALVGGPDLSFCSQQQIKN